MEIPDGEIQRGIWHSLNECDAHFLERGDYVNISFHPYSQKHFYKDDFLEYFPLYFGKIISSNNSVLEDILIKPPRGKSYYYKNKIGTSGFTSISFYRPNSSTDIPEEPEHPYENLINNLS